MREVASPACREVLLTDGEVPQRAPPKSCRPDLPRPRPAVRQATPPRAHRQTPALPALHPLRRSCHCRPRQRWRPARPLPPRPSQSVPARRLPRAALRPPRQTPRMPPRAGAPVAQRPWRATAQRRSPPPRHHRRCSRQTPPSNGLRALHEPKPAQWCAHAQAAAAPAPLVVAAAQGAQQPATNAPRRRSGCCKGPRS